MKIGRAVVSRCAGLHCRLREQCRTAKLSETSGLPADYSQVPSFKIANPEACPFYREVKK